MQEELKILIVEDEVLISERLKQIVIGFGHRVVGICNSLNSVKKFDLSQRPDLVLLDIRMNGINEGIEVAKMMKSNRIPFVFITSFNDKETLQDSVLQSPTGYILKPFSSLEIKKVIANIQKDSAKQHLELKSSSKFIKIPFDDIRWINSSNVYIEIHYRDKKHLERMKLSEVEKLLPQNQFIRIHQSFLVNKNFVTKVESGSVLIDGNTLPVSKKYKIELENWFKSNS